MNVGGNRYSIAYLGNFVPSYSTENHVASSMEFNGHTVTRIQEGEVRAVDVPNLAYDHDVFWHTQTYGLAVTGGDILDRSQMLSNLRKLSIPSVAFHLDKWFGLDREDQVKVEPFFQSDYVFTADGGHQDEFARLGINHIWSPPGVYGPECVIGSRTRQYVKDVAFVGNWRGYHSESTHRMEMIQWLQRNISGSRLGLFPHGQAIRGRDLSNLYASSKIIVGDSCLVGKGASMYWSDRVPETVGRGGFLLHPHVEGLAENYKNSEHMVMWEAGDWDQLKNLISYYLSHESERLSISRAGHRHVKDHHTYSHRVETILDYLRKDGAL